MHIILCPDSMEELMQVLPVLNYLPSEDNQTTILVSEDFDKPLSDKFSVRRYTRETFDAVLLNTIHSFAAKTLILKNNPPELGLEASFQNEEIMDMVSDPYIAAVNLAEVEDLEANDPFFNVVYDTEALIEACRNFYPEGSSRPVVSSPNGMASTWNFYSVHV